MQRKADVTDLTVETESKVRKDMLGQGLIQGIKAQYADALFLEALTGIKINQKEALLIIIEMREDNEIHYRKVLTGVIEVEVVLIEEMTKYLKALLEVEKILDPPVRRIETIGRFQEVLQLRDEVLVEDKIDQRVDHEVGR